MRLFSFLLVAFTLVSVHHVEAVGTELRRVFQARIRVDQQRLEAALAEREKAKAVTVVLNNERPHLVNAATHANAHGDDTVSAAQQTWSNKVMELMGEYWADTLAAHHVAPTFEYAWLIAGSLARGEACAYSDAEAILVVKNADLTAARKLFRHDQFGGKTFLEQYQGIPIEATKYGMAQLGVMFDAAISPRNPGNLPDMFDTAAAFANHAQPTTQTQVRRTLINLIAHPTMRSSAPFAAASLKTIQDGVKTTAKALALLTVAEITRPTEDWFDAGFHLIPNQEFDVKKAFTRPFHFALEILSLYYGVAPDRVNYADRADHLPTAKVHANLARRIKRALQAAYRLRIIAHNLAARESDKISMVASTATTHGLTPAEKTAVDAMVELKKCLKTKFTAWYNKKQNKVLKNSSAFKTDCTCTNAPDSIC